MSRLMTTNFEVYGASNLSFNRVYNSLDKYEGPLSVGWRNSFEYKLVDQNLYVEVWLSTGYKTTFLRNPDDSYSPPTGSNYKLEADGGSFFMTSSDKSIRQRNAFRI